MVYRLLLFILFIIAFWWLNAFVIWHFYKFFSFRIDKYFFLLTLWITSLIPFSMVMHSQFPWSITTWIYYFVMIWLGTVFLGFFISVIFDLTINFLPISLFYKWLVWSSLIISISLYAVYNQSWLPVIKNIDIKVNNLEKPLKIWYLSDVHIDWIHSMDYLEKIINILNEQKVDMVLINWDLVDGTSFEEHSFKVLDKSSSPVFFTYGNHESYVGKDLVTKLLSKTKVKILENEVVEYGWLQIIWIEDMMWMNVVSNTTKLDIILTNLAWNKDAPSLLLLHEPIGSEIADKHWINIQLAWHTHNWQIIPFNFIVKLAFPRVLWLYKIGNLTLYVWPGTWIWWPPMRLGSQNEITIINLSK